MFGFLFHTSKHKHLVIRDDILQLPSGIRILRLKCVGIFEHSGDHLCERAAKLLARTHADGVLLDLSEVTYTYGDDLLLAFEISQHETIERENCPEAVVVGPASQPAVATLLANEAFYDDWRDADFVFTTEQDAIDWLSHKMTANA